jgi:hypothetical protein
MKRRKSSRCAEMYSVLRVFFLFFCFFLQIAGSTLQGKPNKLLEKIASFTESFFFVCLLLLPGSLFSHDRAGNIEDQRAKEPLPK